VGLCSGLIEGAPMDAASISSEYASLSTNFSVIFVHFLKLALLYLAAISSVTLNLLLLP
jgi:hypothetical protein